MLEPSSRVYRFNDITKAVMFTDYIGSFGVEFKDDKESKSQFRVNYVITSEMTEEVKEKVERFYEYLRDIN